MAVSLVIGKRAGNCAVIATQLLALVTLSALWEVLSYVAPGGGRVIPPLADIASALIALLQTGDTYRHIAVTTGEILASIAIGTMMAFVLLLLSSRVWLLVGGLATIFYWVAPTPKIIFFPIALSLFGIDFGSKIAIGSLSVFFPVALSLFSAMGHIRPIYIDVGRSFQFGERLMFTKIYLPCLWAAALTGLRLGAGLGVIGVLLAETKLSNRGLGFLASQYYGAFRIKDLYAVLIVSFALAALINGAISYLETRQRRPS